MKLKMNKIAVAVSAAMGASMVAGVANADSIFFPYVVKSPSVATILSVVNTSDNMGTDIWQNDPATHTHVRLVYKEAANATVNTAQCQSIDRTYPSSRNDLVTFDVGGVFGDDSSVLFGDPTDYSGMDFGLATPASLMRGFVLVDNDPVLAGVGATNYGAEATMFGEALVLEYSNGAAWGYRALNADQDSTSLNFRPEVFGAGVDGLRVPVLGYNDNLTVTQNANGGGMARATILPWGTADQFMTTFFVTPTHTNQYSAYQFSLNALVGPNLVGFGEDASAMMFDRNENPVSGREFNNVACVGAVDVTSMMSGFIVNGPERLTGGWTNIQVATGTLSTASYTRVSHAAVIKLEYNLTETFDGMETGGVFNNAFLMSVDHVTPITTP